MEETVEESIRRAVETKVKQFGSFTERRELVRNDIAVPYGASEMMMYGLRKGMLDAAVTVCDGAGSVIASSPDLVQGIGARMNGLFYTSPLPKVFQSITEAGGTVAFPETAAIDQVSALEKAVRAGYKKIAVTINGFTEEDIAQVKEIEKKYGIWAAAVIVCTTGVGSRRIEHIAAHADVVWSCASGPVREVIGRKSILQITTGIPVFVLTQKGLEFVSAYCGEPGLLRELDRSGQFLISGYIKGRRIKMGTMTTYLSSAVLPVHSRKEPY